MINYNKIEITLESIKEVMENNKYESNRVNVYDLTPEEREERMYIERYNSFPVITLFDELMNMDNEIPEQQYYIDWYLYKCWEWIEKGKANYKNKNGEWERLQWTETAVKVITDRASRAYYSRMMELYIIAVIKKFLPGLSIYSNPILDIYGAVDIMLFDNKKNKVIYAHVLKKSERASSQLNTKSVDRRKFYYKDPETNKRYDFLIDRDFTTHTSIKYGGEMSKNINGYKVPFAMTIVAQISRELKREDIQTVDNPEYLMNLINAVSEAFPEIPFIDLSNNDNSLIS